VHQIPMNSLRHEKMRSEFAKVGLGNVHRAKEQIKMLTEKLLRLHIPEAEKDRTDPIVEMFTRRLFSHDYLIGRQEAKQIIGPEVVDAPQAVEQAMMDLYNMYAEDLELNAPYNPEGILGKETQKVGTFRRAYIESADGCWIYRTVQEIKRIQVQPTQFGIQVRQIEERWVADND